MDRHNQRVQQIAHQVRLFHARKVPFRVYHGGTNSTRPVHFDSATSIDISRLTNVLSIDTSNNTALVEPNVALDQLVHDTLPRGVMPAVVPEFPGITVGGAFAGTGGESSSFKFGFFDASVNWAEIVLGNGEVVRTSPTENADLFFGTAGAMGTLGIATLLEVRLVPCPGYVLVEYHPVESAEEAVDKIKAMSGGKDGYDFLDGILYSPRCGVIITGKLASKKAQPGVPLARFTRARDPWFSFHVHDKLVCPPQSTCIMCQFIGSRKPSARRRAPGRAKPLKELVPIQDYLFRYERGVFWCSAYGWPPSVLRGSFNVRRWLCDPLFHTRYAYRFMHHARTYQVMIIQDVAIPAESTTDFLSFLDEEVRVYPLWLCPIMSDKRCLMHRSRSSGPGVDSTVLVQKQQQLVINIGVWGFADLGQRLVHDQVTLDALADTNRAIEKKLLEVNGLKWLYAWTYYTEEEFWAVYDREQYEALREKWWAQSLPSVWDKVRRPMLGWQKLRIWRGHMYAALNLNWLR